MSHGIGWKAYAYIAAVFGFAYYLSTAHRGPWAPKYAIPPKTKEKYADCPMFATDFRPDTHPALTKEF